jgi:hypothetical protein
VFEDSSFRISISDLGFVHKRLLGVPSSLLLRVKVMNN